MSGIRSSSSLACDCARTVTSPFSRPETPIYLNRIYSRCRATRPFRGGRRWRPFRRTARGPGPSRRLRTPLRPAASSADSTTPRPAAGELSAFHDARTRQGDPLAAISYSRLCELAGYPVPRVADVMAMIGGEARGHLDRKDTGGKEQVAEMALDVLGAGNFVVTTLEDRSVAAIKARFPAVPVGLSLGRDLDEVPRSRRAATRLSELL